MTPLGWELVFFGLRLAPCVVWALVVRNGWEALVRARPGRRQLLALLTLLGTLVSLWWLIQSVLTLVPLSVHEVRPRWLSAAYFIGDVCTLTALALYRHLARASDAVGRRVTRAWLVGTYGASLAVIVFAATFLVVVPLPTLQAKLGVFSSVMMAYTVVCLVLGARDLRRLWTSAGAPPWAGGGIVLRTDRALLAAAAVVAAAAMTVHATMTPETLAVWMLHDVLVVLVGALVTIPVALRMLGLVVVGLTQAAVAIAVVALTAFVVGPWLYAQVGPPLHLLAGAICVLVVALGLPLLLSFVRAGIEALLPGGDAPVQALLASVHRLPPELGVVECARRALDDAVRLVRVRGAGILLRDGHAVAAGVLDVEAVRAALPARPEDTALADGELVWPEFGRLPAPLRRALLAAHVVRITPIASARRPWGWLLVSPGAVASAGGPRDAAAAFAGELALVFDAADLLARAVAVERSLAHAEKLAAVGELAARVAHEIRNPVTAARSLAQQLARGSANPADVEAAALIVDELERIERQVAALLRFARREDFVFAPVDVGALVRSTMDAFRPRFAAAAVGLELDAADDVVARGDGEKLRQVVVNLVENALDALGEANGDRRLHVAVDRVDGHARLRVRDTGPGVPADALPHLFEPFYSRKATGTGLGLAIVKRTIDAHGGQIAATSAGEGTTFAIALPLAEAS